MAAITEEQLKQLRHITAALKHGDKMLIAKKLKGKSSYSEVVEVLKGTYYKESVIEAALDLIEERMRKTKAREQKIAKRIGAVAK